MSKKKKKRRRKMRARIKFIIELLIALGTAATGIGTLIMALR